MFTTVQNNLNFNLYYREIKDSLRKQRSRYLMATAVLLVIVIVSQVYIKYTISIIEKDATVINLAGSQRMRSVQITQLSLRSFNGEFLNNKLLNTSYQFNLIHNALTNGSDSLNIPPCQNTAICLALNSLKADINSLNESVNSFVQSSDTKHKKSILNTIISVQQNFLPRMNEVVLLIEQQNSKELQLFQTIKFIFGFIIISTLLLEVFFIFMPGYHYITKQVEWLNETETILTKVENTVIVTDPNGVATWANEAFTRLTGYDREDLIGKKPGDLLQGELTSKGTVNKIRYGLTTKAPFYVEIINYHRLGLPYWVNLQITPILDSQGNVKKFISVQSDITERKNVEDRIKKSNSQLTEYNKKLDEQKEELSQQAVTMKEYVKRLDEKHEALKVQSYLLETQNNKIRESINYAKRIQKAVTSDKYIIDKYFTNSFIFNKPKDIVSGDFFWSSKIDNSLFIVVADCTGHGVPGAIMSTIGISLLDRIIGVHKLKQPNIILQALQFELKRLLQDSDNSVDDGMDIGLITLDFENMKLSFSGAFHNLYVVTKEEKEKVNIIRGNRFGIGGIYSNSLKIFEITHLDLKSLHRLFMFTDGVKDQFGSDLSPVPFPKTQKNSNALTEQKFTQKRIISIIEKNSFNSLNHINKDIETSINSWMGERRQTDDMLMLGVELDF